MYQSVQLGGVIGWLYMRSASRCDAIETVIPTPGEFEPQAQPQVETNLFAIVF